MGEFCTASQNQSVQGALTFSNFGHAGFKKNIILIISSEHASRVQFLHCLICVRCWFAQFRGPDFALEQFDAYSDVTVQQVWISR